MDETGRVDLAKIESVEREINLRPLRSDLFTESRSDLGGGEEDFKDGIPKALIPNLVFGPFSDKNQKTAKAVSGVLTLVRGSSLSTFHQYSKEKDIVNRDVDILEAVEVGGIEPPRPWLTNRISYQSTPTARLLYQKEELQQELEEELKKQEKIEAVLASVGGKVENPKFKVESLKLSEEQITEDVAARTVFSPVGREIEARLEKFQEENIVSSDVLRASDDGVEEDKGQAFLKTCPVTRRRRWFGIQGWTLGIGLLIAFLVGGFFLFQKGLGLKQNLISKGEQAIRNLEQAKVEVEKFDFVSAADSFSLAYSNFSDISSRLNLAGGSLASLLSAGGFSDLKSAKNLTQAGSNIAEAGKILTEAAGGFYGSNPVEGLGFGSEDKKSLSEIITPFREAVVSARGKIKTASQLLASVDESIIPEEQRRPFLDFRAQLPLLEEFAGEAANYADFLSELTGASGPKKYLLIFQNNSELRPTGGFFGSYALVDFNRGFLRNLAVDDVYNIDGQAKKNIIPPRELQHITPTWGMRDANWFVNFPDSARKVMEMYTENNGGPAVDGVIAITPSIITKMLEVIGPVEMPEYGRNVGSDNFLAEIQEEIEYGENRVQPKTILVDFTPRFLEKLGQQDTEQWLKIFQILANGIEQKHLLAYFKNSKLEETVLKNGFGGEIKNTDGDFLMIAHSNVKGSKTDAVIDSSYELESRISEDGFVEHNLKIKRKHNGGKTKFGFYNRTNFDFVRVLVPEGSEVLGVRGDYKPDFKPLVDYGKIGGFVVDSDLEKYETCSYKVEPCTEAGKAVFGFWIKIEPGQEREVVLNYKTPMRISGGEYSLLVQKQPGTVDDEFSFNFELAENKTVIYKYPELAVDDNVVYFDTYLFKDLVVGFKFR